MKRALILLLLASSTPCFGATPSDRLLTIQIMEPKSDQSLKIGDVISARWRIKGPSSARSDWDVYVDLLSNEAGWGGNKKIYFGPLTKDPGAAKLPVIDAAAFNVSQIDPGWRVRVCLYNRRLGNEEMRDMALTGKAAPTDKWLLCEYSTGSIKVMQ